MDAENLRYLVKTRHDMFTHENPDGRVFDIFDKFKNEYLGYVKYQERVWMLNALREECKIYDNLIKNFLRE